MRPVSSAILPALPPFLLPALLLPTLLLAAVGCPAPGELQVRGEVVEVVPRNFSEVERLRIRDKAGLEYVFETEGFVGFTPSHVKEHQLLGQSLLVTYERRGDRLVATALAD